MNERKRLRKKEKKEIKRSGKIKERVNAGPD